MSTEEEKRMLSLNQVYSFAVKPGKELEPDPMEVYWDAVDQLNEEARAEFLAAAQAALDGDICAFHSDSLGWDQCSLEYFEDGNIHGCAVERMKRLFTRE